MSRPANLLLGLAALASVLLLTGCEMDGQVHTSPLRSSSTRLTPHPDKIYLAPFDLTTARFEVGRQGLALTKFKEEYQMGFLHKLEKETNRIAPTEPRWLDDLPDHGWLVGGEFITVDQGSRFLRGTLGLGNGETTLETKVYVYDLSISKTEYILAFRTGGGSGTLPSGLTVAAEPVLTGMAIGAGLKLDATRTCKAILEVLKSYY